jgi:2,4-diaminopentanoate dehydrogenase
MTYKIIQWGTGPLGTMSLREIIDNPRYELVGVYEFLPEKEGLDGGEICRRPATGIRATKDIEQLLALKADCVIFMPRVQPDFEPLDRDVMRLLESGKNVIATVGYFYPKTHGQAYVDRLTAACMKGGATLHGTGIDPGFLVERLAVAATSISFQVDHIYFLEQTDCTPFPVPSMVFDTMGFGSSPESFPPPRNAAVFDRMFHEVVTYVADALQIPLDRIEHDHIAEMTAKEDLNIPAGRLPTGGVTSMRYDYRGISGGREVIMLRLRWYVGGERPSDSPGGEAIESDWLIRVTGRPGLELSVNMLSAPGRPKQSVAFLASQAAVGNVINSIPAVCKAPPGILTNPTFNPSRFSSSA